MWELIALDSFLQDRHNFILISYLPYRLWTAEKDDNKSNQKGKYRNEKVLNFLCIVAHIIERQIALKEGQCHPLEKYCVKVKVKLPFLVPSAGVAKIEWN